LRPPQLYHIYCIEPVFTLHVQSNGHRLQAHARVEAHHDKKLDCCEANARHGKPQCHQKSVLGAQNGITAQTEIWPIATFHKENRGD